MSDKHRDTESYVHRVGEAARRYTKELLRDNNALRAQVVTLTATESKLHARIRRLEDEIARMAAEESRLRESLAGIEAESRSHLDRYAGVEQQNTALANLYVASYRLHATLDHDQVIAAIQEIVVNLIGSEELAIFEVNDEGTHLILSAAMGIDADVYRNVPLDHGFLGNLVRQKTCFVAGEADRDAPVTACIPLVLEGEVIGAIAIFGLLPHKEQLGDLDQELFELLATHAATALYCTRLHAALGVRSAA